MLEKRTLSHHKSNRGMNASVPELPSIKQVASEVVAVDNGVVQIKQNQYDLVIE